VSDLAQGGNMGDSLLDKRICVTGGGGFLGSCVVSRLRERGYRNVDVVRKRDYDLVYRENVERLYRHLNPEIVIHLAAVVGGIGANRENPGRFFYENIIMGIQLLEEARLHGIEKFVQIGTICAYPKFTPVPFKEEDLWNGYPEEVNAPYGVAKKALFVQAQSYREQYGLNAISLLPVNLYGPGDNFDLQSSHVIPALIKKCVNAVENGDPFIEVWGTGQATREFIYVDDAAEGIILAMEQYNSSEPINIGTGREIRIDDLVNLISLETGFTGEIRWNRTKPDGQPRRMLDVTRAKELFGFEAKTTFIEGLRQTIHWYRTTNCRQLVTAGR
jgi:GDP-L-fucose synthase